MYMNDSAFFMNVVFIGMLVFTGISITLFVVFKILNRFNDFGDSFCKMDDYAPRAIHFLRDVDDVESCLVSSFKSFLLISGHLH